MFLSHAHSPELEIFFFEFDSYLTVEDGPPVLITPDDVLSQACRIRLIYREPREMDPGEVNAADEPEGLEIWVTCGLTRVRL